MRERRTGPDGQLRSPHSVAHGRCGVSLASFDAFCRLWIGELLTVFCDGCGSSACALVLDDCLFPFEENKEGSRLIFYFRYLLIIEEKEK